MNALGTIVTFYSYKGGVGRSMALSNVAVLLARSGFSVLAVDWDLEAPGLEGYFVDYANAPMGQYHLGVVDLLHSAQTQPASERNKKIWKRGISNISIGRNCSFDFLSAGKRDSNYFARMKEFDVETFYQRDNGGAFIEDLRIAWRNTYNFILIDSRTGLTDHGGICTIQLPDILMMLFSPTRQGLQGTKDIAERAVKARQELPSDRQKLITIPIPSRIDNAEFKLYSSWLERAAGELSGMCSDWLPKDFHLRDFFELVKVPYRSFYSFEEKLAVIEEKSSDPNGLAYAYTTIAALIGRKLDGINLLKTQRDRFVNAVDPSSTLRKEIIESSRKKGVATIFASYSPFNEFNEDRNMTSLLRLLNKEINLQIGLDIDLLYDRNHVDWRESWRKWQEGSLDGLVMLLPIISPAFFNDEICRGELQSFLDQERGISRQSLIRPIYYIETPIARPGSGRSKENNHLNILRTRYFFDWQELRFADFTSNEVRKKIAECAAILRDIIKPEPKEDLASNMLNIGESRFVEETSKRHVIIAGHGTWEACFVINGDLPRYEADKPFLDMILDVPKYSGWPLWLDTRNYDRKEDKPYSFMGAWEVCIASPKETFVDRVDFWRCDPRGYFYHRRAFEDDISSNSNRPAPGTSLDFGLPIWRVAEAMALAIAITKKLNCIPNHTTLTFVFRWTGLANRKINSWTEPRRVVFPRVSSGDTVTSFVTIPLSTELEDIYKYVQEVVQPLFENFDGLQIGPSVVQEMISKALKLK